MARKLIDLTGMRFGSWLVLRRDGSHQIAPTFKSPYGHSVPMWLCKCDCGTVSSVSGANLRSGRSTGCHLCRDKKRTEGVRRYHRNAARVKSMFPGEFDI